MSIIYVKHARSDETYGIDHERGEAIGPLHHSERVSEDDKRWDTIEAEEDYTWLMVESRRQDGVLIDPDL